MSEKMISVSSLKKTKNKENKESRKEKTNGYSSTDFIFSGNIKNSDKETNKSQNIETSYNKNNKENNNRVFTINTEIKSSLLKTEEIDFLNSYLKEFNHVKFKYTALLQKGRILPDYQVSDIKKLCDENNKFPYRIFNAGMMQSVNSQMKSHISNKKNYLDNTLDDIKDCLKKLEKSY